MANKHNIQPSVNDMISYAKTFMKKTGCEYIFLAVEDEESRNAFEQAFADRLLSTNCILGKYGDKRNVLAMAEVAARDVGRVQSGIDYLMEIMLLSKCDSLLASGNNGTFTAIIVNGGKYDFIENVNLGKQEENWHV